MVNLFSSSKIDSALNPRSNQPLIFANESR